jgi:hypothetical protein
VGGQQLGWAAPVAPRTINSHAVWRVHVSGGIARVCTVVTAQTAFGAQRALADKCLCLEATATRLFAQLPWSSLGTSYM